MAPKTPPAARPTLSVIERRLQGEDPFRASSKPIPLRQPTLWVLRWENAEIGTDHMWEVVNVLGWEYCAPEDIACAPDEIGAMVRDGRIVRGERGAEPLMKMRTVDYEALQKRQTAENIRRTFEPGRLKQQMTEQASAQLGDQGASFINRSVHQPTIQDHREMVPLDE